MCKWQEANYFKSCLGNKLNWTWLQVEHASHGKEGRGPKPLSDFWCVQEDELRMETHEEIEFGVKEQSVTLDVSF